MTKNKPIREVFVFFGLTLGLSYFVFWGPLAFFQIPASSFVRNIMGPTWAIALYIVGGFVPSLAALFLTWKHDGKIGLRSLWQRIIQFNIGLRWYGAAVLVVVLGTLGQLVIIRLMGNPFDLTVFLKQMGSALPLFILGPLSEEIGWRGYALDRLQTKWNALTSSLILGLVWGFWHLPLFAMIGTSQYELAIPFVGFVVGLMVTAIIFTWLHNNTHSSIWMAIFFHWVWTYSAQVMASGVTRSVLYNWLEYLPYVLIAVVIVSIWKPTSLKL
jgi:membrane protease YdiL (CAAX protease family)